MGSNSRNAYGLKSGANKLEEVNSAYALIGKSIAIVAALRAESGDPLTSAEVKALYELNLNTNAFTDTEKAKLAALEEAHFKGVYVSLAALQAAYPTATAGDYAYVDDTVSTVVYAWNVDTVAWTLTSEPSNITSAQVKTLYEANPDTNAYTDAEKLKLTGIELAATDNATDITNINVEVFGVDDNTVTPSRIDTLETESTIEQARLIDVVTEVYGLNDTSVVPSRIDLNATAVALLENPVSVKLAPQVTDPAYVKGQLWYDDNYGSPAVHTDIEGVLLHVLTDTPIRIINRTGATIPALTAIRNGGADVATNEIMGVAAQANSMFTAFVIGVTPVAILPDAEGWVIADGHIHNVDTSALTQGLIMFLDDISVGNIIQANPKIASSLGTVLKSDAVDGEIFVKINNLIEYPTVVGYLRRQVNPSYSLSATPVTLVGYVDSDGVTMVPDQINGKLPMPIGGIYSTSFAIVMTFLASASTRTIFAELYNVTQAQPEGAMPINIPRDAVTAGGSFPAMITSTTGDEYVIRLTSDVVINVDITNVAFAMDSNYIG